MEPVDGSVFINGDINDKDVRVEIQKALKLAPVDVVLADLDFDRKFDMDMDC